MSLYLVQHGASLSKEQDPEKGLSAEGAADAERIAGVAAGYNVRVSRIVHSGKKRAAQTAEIMAAHLNPEGGVRSISGIDPLDDVASFSNDVDLQGNVMVVGHLPFLEKLIAYLVTGDQDRLVFKMQNAGIVCLDRHPQGETIVINWALMPKIGS